MALKAHSDWLLKVVEIPFAIHLRGTRARFAAENIIIVSGVN